MANILDELYEAFHMNEAINNPRNTLEFLVRYIVDRIKVNVIRTVTGPNEFRIEFTDKILNKEGSIRVYLESPPDYLTGVVPPQYIMAIYYDDNSSQYFGLQDYFEFRQKKISRIFIGDINTPEEKMIPILDKIVKVFNQFVKTRKPKLNKSGGFIEELESILGMVDENTEQYGLRGIAARYKMSYQGNFKYGDLFEVDPEYTKFAKSIFRQAQIPAPLKGVVAINKVWSCKDDPDILLVSATNYHFLTTRADFDEDLENIRNSLQK